MTKLQNVFLVGGAVRDQLLGLESKDLDYVVVGETPEHMLELGFVSVGADFPVFLHPHSKEEYALARTERKSGKGYKGFTVEAGTEVTLEEDLARRDLTINAMAMSQDGEIIDPFHGQADLKNKILRHTTQAFTEDPVRVLRVARFLARYGHEWQIHPETLTLMQQIKAAGELDNLVPERVWKETEKALGEKHPELYFEALQGLGIFPELERMVGVPQPPKHHPEGDVFVHTMLAVRRAADLQFDVETRFAALTHDFGKALCYEARGNLYGHEQEGVALIESFCERLRVPNRFRQLAVLTSDNHTRLHKIFELRPNKLHKLLIETLDVLGHPLRFQQFWQACQCDAQGRGPTLVDKPYPQADFAQAVADEMARFDKKAAARQAMEKGKRGPKIGEAVREAEINWLRDFLADTQ